MTSIQILEKPGELVKIDQSFPNNQIKAREKSESAIKNHWLKLKLSLTAALDEAKKILVEDQYEAQNSSELTQEAQEEIAVRTKVIARLEELVKIQSKESVPKNYVGHRAIKLKKEMAKNLVYNADSAYFSLNIEAQNSIFNQNSSSTKKIEKETENEEKIDSQDISLEQVFTNYSSTMANEINEAMNENGEVQEQEVLVEQQNTLAQEENTSIPQGNIFAQEENNSKQENILREEDIRQVLEESFNPVKVASEEVAHVVVEGRKQDYTPMTDEEIARARTHLWPTIEETPEEKIIHRAVEKVTLYQDTNQIYARKYLLNRFQLTPVGSEVIIKGLLCYPISMEDVNFIEQNQYNNYSPYILTIENVELENKKNITNQEEGKLVKEGIVTTSENLNVIPENTGENNLNDDLAWTQYISENKSEEDKVEENSKVEGTEQISDLEKELPNLKEILQRFKDASQAYKESSDTKEKQETEKQSLQKLSEESYQNRLEKLRTLKEMAKNLSDTANELINKTEDNKNAISESLKEQEELRKYIEEQNSASRRYQQQAEEISSILHM